MSTLVWETNSTVIQRLRIRSPERDANSLQLRLTAMLNAAELRPHGLPASAILIVRKMGREVPPVRLDRHSVRPPAEWQDAVSETLDVLSRRAVRPAAGSAAPDGDSVLFLDRSEMLACLACDWLDGVLLSRWWWRCLFPREDLVQALLSGWSESPQYIPAAMERMARTGQAAPFVRQLPSALAKVLIGTIMRAFALPELERAIEALCGATGPVSMDTGQGGSAPARVAWANGQSNRRGDAPPWTPWVPEANGPELTLDQRLLTMTALMLQRAPHAIRQRAFAAELRQWGQAMRRRASWRAAALPPSVFVPGQHAVDAAYSDVASSSSESSNGTQMPSSVRESDISEPGSRNSRVYSRAKHEKAADEWSAPLLPELAPAGEHALDLGTAEEEDAGPPGGLAAVVEMATTPEFCLAQPFEGIEIETEFGGVFYLINVAIYLGFYGDFSAPAEPGIDLSIWDFVAMTGSELDGALRDDPVWALLATLSGRTGGEEPGQDFDQAWLEVAMQQVRERLQVALALEGPDDPGAFLLRHQARVQATATHLDVFLSLDELPVPIRIARLDRDPGWVPAAGRHIAFHFA